MSLNYNFPINNLVIYENFRIIYRNTRQIVPKKKYWKRRDMKTLLIKDDKT